VPDICQAETKMWFFFLAATYMDIGVEAIHFGQLDLMGRNDRQYRNWADLLRHVRGYAARKARRRFLISDAPQQAVLAVGYSDALYGRSNGGLTPSGWKCEHLPYLAEFDNFGGTRAPGQASQTRGPSIFTWGFDEITWFAWQPESYRNEWLRYAWNWLKEHDPNGHLQMPGSRMLTNGPPDPAGGGRLRWYFATTRSPACPQGFSQEETITAIWVADHR
jgi:hypothetical protein